MKTPNTFRRRFVLGLLVVLTVMPVQADRHWDEDEKHDHERARHALRRGEVRPIAEILASVATQVPGEVVEVEFEHERKRDHGPQRWRYELKIIATDGRLLEVEVDAATGRILKVEED
ncbi:PepSY domain-containing protein [Thiorhodococcus fuscus]|uniref:PepSY domain-containing protein n=1 Tax=Thiorhodococcus fuscus TaxID=527200 RepID=A0ABW4Y649_9GAMM